MSAVVFLVLRIALTACLYIFLITVFVTLWKSVRQQGLLLAARKVPAMNLTAQVPGQPASLFRFKQAEITIGRDLECDVALDDALVSAHHARLSYHHGQWWVDDLNSTNGTYLNAEKLLSSTVVISGDEIRCGDSVIFLQIEETNPVTFTSSLNV